MKRFFYIILTVSLILSGFLIKTPVFATTYYTVNNGIDTPSYSSDFTNYKGEIFNLMTSADLSSATVNIYNCYGGNSTAKFIIASQDGTIKTSSTFSIAGGSGCFGGYAPTINFPAIELNPDYYFFGIKMLTGDSFAFYSNTDAYGNSGKFTWNGTSTFYCTSSFDCSNQFIDNKDISGTISGFAPGSGGEDGSTVEINWPLDNSTHSSISDIGKWNIGWTLITPRIGHIDYLLRISQSTSTILNGSVCNYPFTATSGQSCFFGLSGGLDYYKTETSGQFQALIPPPLDLPTSTWYAKVYLKNWQDINSPYISIASSSIIKFSLNNTSTTNPTLISIAPSVNSQSNQEICVNFTDNLVTEYLCRALLYIFRPSDSIFDNFQTLGDQIKNKPPFGYFTIIQNDLNNISTSSPAYILATSTAFTNNIFTPIKTGFSWILWFIFGFWVFHRLRNVQL